MNTIENIAEFKDIFKEFQGLMMHYECAMLEVKTKLDVLNAELAIRDSRNPFETIKTRIKKPMSIIDKLRRDGLEINIDNIRNNLNDVAGIRVICSFPDDIYKLADYLAAQDDIKVIARKDYIANPKPNGYRSLHLIVEIPIFLTDEKKLMRVEVQFRTIAMMLGWLPVKRTVFIGISAPTESFLLMMVAIRKVKIQVTSSSDNYLITSLC